MNRSIFLTASSFIFFYILSFEARELSVKLQLSENGYKEGERK